MFILLFFLSGASALVYQTAWQRMLALGSGVGIYSVAMIVAAFMAGLGLGSHAGGVLSSRVTARRALRLFGVIEASIGAFGALSPWLLHDVLYLRASWLYAAPLRAGLVHFATLVVPTALMGTSLPFLVRGCVRDARTASRTVGNLYGVNTLGAAFGALAAPWWLVRFFGIEGAIFTAAATNLAVGVAAVALASGVAEGEALPRPAAAGDEPPGEVAGGRPFGLWLALYASSGFVALAFEILWFRLVDVALKSSAFTFGTVLAIYLLGCGSGAVVGARVAPRIARPLRAFLVCQCALVLAAALAVIALVRLPPEAGLAWFFDYWSRYEGVTLGRDAGGGTVLRLYLLLPALLYGLPTVLMGFVFPILQRAVHDDVRTSGRKVGLLQAANIAGCVAGSLIVGLVALNGLGSTGTLRVLLLAGLGFAVVGARHYGWRDAFGAWAAALILAIALVPGQEALWSRLHGIAPGAGLIQEDATSVGAITPETSGGWRVSVNGKGNSQLPYGSVHTYLGAVPVLMHEAPLDVAIIGLGSGDTAWAAACRPETRRLTVFELSRPQPLLLRRLLERDPLPAVWTLLHDGRLDVVLDDGRSSLEHQGALYDMIEADALRPTSAGSGNLYSVEFFEACARRLKPRGLVCTWAPTSRIYASFCRAFPSALELSIGETLLVGSSEELVIDRGAWRARLESPEVAAYLGPEIAARVLTVLRSARRAGPLARAGNGEVNTDLFPRDEFLTP